MPSAAVVVGLGFALGLSLAAPPGPILALSAQRAVRQGFWPGVVVALGATCGDATYAALMGAGVLPLVRNLEWLVAVLNASGAVLMAVLAGFALRAARAPGLPAPPRAGPATEASAATRLAGGWVTGYGMALTSPFNFGWWLGAGTLLFREYGPPVFVGFFAALVVWSFAFVALVRWTSRRVARLVQVLSYASALVLAAFAAYVLYTVVERAGLVA